MDKSNILIVGSVAFDTIETPSSSIDMALGGSAVFASMAASYFTSPRVVGIVGEDFGGEHFERLENRGIDTAGIEKVAGGKTEGTGGQIDHRLQRGFAGW